MSRLTISMPDLVCAERAQSANSAPCLLARNRAASVTALCLMFWMPPAGKRAKRAGA